MNRYLPYFAILVIIVYALYNYLNIKTKNIKKIQTTQSIEHIKDDQIKHKLDLITELNSINKPSYIKKYIVSVINNGSNQFNFPGGIMEGGFATPADAEDIACYILEFSNKKCETPYNKNASLIYTSNCAGCHGLNGKGINGTYPNLRREKLLGIKKREEFLKSLNKKRTK